MFSYHNATDKLPAINCNILTKANEIRRVKNDC